MDDKTNLQAFVTNLGKYTEGHLIGEWVSFPTDRETMQQVFDRIGINEQYPEYFITDYDIGIREMSEYLGEYQSLDELNYLAKEMAGMDEQELSKFEGILQSGVGLPEQENAKAYINLIHNLDCYELLEGVTNDEEYGSYILTNSEISMNNNEQVQWLLQYVDTEAVGRDACINDQGNYCDAGYICRNGNNYEEIYHGLTDDIPGEYRVTGDGQNQELMKEAERLMEQAETQAAVLGR